MLTKSIVHNVSTLRKSIVEKLEVFHSEMEPGPDRGREFAGCLFLGALVCGTCRSEAFGGDGEALIHWSSNASWAAIPTH
jgi:hypothetical protein